MNARAIGEGAVGLGLLGFGVVGSAVYRLIEEGQPWDRSAAGVPLAIRRVAVRHPERVRNPALPPAIVTADPWSVVEDPGIGVVIEVMGGLEPARSLVLRALDLGKVVVTANKELVARYGPELVDAASRADSEVYFEASVAGGIPVVRPLREMIVGGLERVVGIVNGTTNFILTRMAAGETFEDALRTAQRAGYAEADPSADVDGHDAARKIAILAGLAFQTFIPPDAIPVAGIREVTSEDIRYGLRRGLVLRLVAEAHRTPRGVAIGVGPAFVPASHPFAQAVGVENVIAVQGRAVGDVLFAGPGAGGLPTSSAVVADVLAAVRLKRPGGRAGNGWPARALPLEDLPPTPYYLRLPAGAGIPDDPGIPVARMERLPDSAVAFETEPLHPSAVRTLRARLPGALAVRLGTPERHDDRVPLAVAGGHTQ